MTSQGSRDLVSAGRVALAAGALALVSYVEAAGEARVMDAFGRLPLSFEKNDGQIDPRVRFLSRGRGYRLFLTPSEVVLSLQETREPRLAGAEPFDGQTGTGAKPRAWGILRMKFEGGKAKPEMTGVDELPGKSNYFIGNDPKGWRTNVPQYGHVLYRGVWKGIDVMFYGTNQSQLECDFTVSPGADPAAIRMAFEGPRNVRLDEGGNLVLEAGAGEVVQHRPLIYQEVGGVRRALSGSWVLKGKNRVGFRVASYDRKEPLVIDPVLVYSTYLGGSSADAGYGIAVDASGSAYVTGQTQSLNFPTADPFQATHGGSIFDAFVAKLNAAGSALVYSSYLGGNADDGGSAIAVDALGNAYVTGATSAANFPTVNPLQPAIGGWNDAFVAKLNAAGSALVYSTYLGGSGFDPGTGIAVDGDGNAYVTGQTNSTNFPTANPIQAANGGGFADAFVAKLNAAGSALLYSTYLGGSGNDEGSDIALGVSGNAIVTGFTDSANFPTVSPLQGAYGGGSTDAFVANLNPAGSALVYSTYLGGSGVDQAFGIAVDTSGNAYITGLTISADFPTVNPLQGVYAGGAGDAFVAKLNAAGSALVYSTYLGGSGTDLGRRIALDASRNAYLTGSTRSSDFPTANPLLVGANGIGGCPFVANLNPAGSALVYSTYLGGGGIEEGNGIAVDSGGSAYVTGQTSSQFFPTVNPIQAANGGDRDAFVTKIGTGSSFSNLFTVAPCRVLDTRDPAGFTGGLPLFANTIHTFPVTNICGIPSGATAVSANVAVTQPSEAGNLRVYPGFTPAPLVSSINYAAGQTRSNNAIVSLNSGAIAVRCAQASGTVHFILDVNGYFQ